MRFLAQPENPRFTNKEMLIFMLPVFFESLLVGLLGIADTTMVSYLGQTAVAGVSLVNRIDNFAKQFFIALGQGGSVILSQYIGANDEKDSQVSLKANIGIVTAIGAILMALMIFFRSGILNLFFGKAEADVLAMSEGYFSITAISYPFVALYYACTAALRVMGESKIPFYSSIAMMGVNLILKYIFIFIWDLGVGGAALSTLISMALCGIVLTFYLTRKQCRVRLTGIFKFDVPFKMVTTILKVSIPNGIEQAMFQLGALLIASLVSGLGTAAIAADQIARNLSVFIHAMGSAAVALMMMAVGQCMGAQEQKEAERYTKHILKIDYIATIISCIVFAFICTPLVSLYKVSDDAKTLAVQILALYAIFSCTFYPSSFAVPASLRAAGDTKFVMVVSSLSMFLFRIGAAYIFVNYFDMGIIGTWVAMVSDWIIRTVIFAIRFKHGKWKQRKVI